MWDTTLLILLVLAVLFVGGVVLKRAEFRSVFPRRRPGPPRDGQG
ncbi:MAG TPA: hypothetical protein VE033_09540 [Acetobacteraceae bacterium]|jgi:hypothetical protein|nr:hypothetical protein [Acetobacteraceae bacterium]